MTAGDVILSLAPLAHALSTSCLPTTCDGCLLALAELRSGGAAATGKAIVDELLVCSGCKLTRYCSKVSGRPSRSSSIARPSLTRNPSPPPRRSKACQTTSWPTHKPECRAFASLRAAYSASRAKSGAAKIRGEWVPSEAVRALGRLAGERRTRREGNGGRDDGWVRHLPELSV